MPSRRLPTRRERLAPEKPQPAEASPTEIAPVVEPIAYPLLGTLKHPGVLIVGFVLGVICFLVYSNSFDCGLVLDNFLIIGNDFRLKSPKRENVELIFNKGYWWPTWESNLFRPLTTLSYMVNYSVFANEKVPNGYHLVNLFLHWVNTTLLYGLMLSVTRRHWLSFGAAALFAVHPLNTESVTNIVGRADLLVALVVLVCLHLHRLAYLASFAGGLGLRAMMFAVALAGVFCKESAIVILPLLIVYDCSMFKQRGQETVWQAIGRRFRQTGWVSYAAVLPAVCALFGVRHLLLAESPVFDEIGADNPIVAAFAFNSNLVTAWLCGRMTAIKVIGYYAWKFVCPATLSCDYSYDQIPLFGWTLTDPNDVAAWVSLLLVGASLYYMFFRALFRNRPLFFFMMFFWLAFGPTSNLLFGVGSIMGERFMYLPLIGVVGAVAVAASSLLDRATQTDDAVARKWRSALVPLGALVVVALGVRSYCRNFDWLDEMSLWTSAAETCPDSFKVYKGLAGAIVGPHAEAKPINVLDRAIETAERGTTILEAKPLPPWHMPNGIYQDVARYYIIKGDKLITQVSPTMQHIPPAAIHCFERAAFFLERAREMDQSVNEKSVESRRARGMPEEKIVTVGNFRIYLNLAVAYMRVTRWDDAIKALERMLELEPTAPEGYLNMAAALRQKNQHSKSAVYLMAAMIVRQQEFPNIWENLRGLFAVIAPNQPAIVQGQDQHWHVNMDNPVAARHFQEAFRETIRIMLHSKRFGLAVQLHNLAINQYRLPPQVFENMRAELTRASKISGIPLETPPPQLLQGGLPAGS
ncbi:MAG: DUF1736 domain-containing protein [Planctomycetes bacterium]|nr:DUF1736 domain-containing protein [Planctomycetota bacterium]